MRTTYSRSYPCSRYSVVPPRTSSYSHRAQISAFIASTSPAFARVLESGSFRFGFRFLQTQPASYVRIHAPHTAQGTSPSRNISL
jgi:hypothetical protein